ncbi:hypothetical protein BYT27DRAFT_7145999 [Phlegmacium glaucopus]|nr:hypothetical protein BYT27DRAFT_7145999 [Phlegmacium glaucopus]
MAQTATAPTSQANRPRVTKILTQKIGSMPTTVAPRKRPSEVSVAQGSADVIPKLFGDGSPLGTTVDATQGIGGVDDLLGLSNTTFNFMPSTNPRSSSLLDLSPTFAASW